MGMRILQVNSVSMLGKTHEEVMKTLQGVVDRINLLVCHGYDSSALQFLAFGTEWEGEEEELGYESLYEKTVFGGENGHLSSKSR